MTGGKCQPPSRPRIDDTLTVLGIAHSESVVFTLDSALALLNENWKANRIYDPRWPPPESTLRGRIRQNEQVRLARVVHV